jgi:hypothetical protein
MCTDRVGRTVRRARGARGQGGQALVEAIVASAVLATLFLLVPMLGKYLSIRQATIASSRWLAFECTVRIDDCRDADAHPELVDELRRRHFGATNLEVLTADRAVDPVERGASQALWVDRRNRLLLERYADVGGRIREIGFDAGLAVAIANGGRALAGAARILSDQAGPGKFGLDIEEGLLRARVQAAVSSSSEARTFVGQLDSIGLRPHASSAILVDGWGASGPYGSDPRSVESRVERGASLGSAVERGLELAYAPMRGFLDLMTRLQLEPEGGRFDYHHIDVDLVPPDRLGSAR